MIKKTKNLYEFYGVSGKEELYNQLKKGNKNLAPLQEIIDLMKLSKEKFLLKITNSSSLREHFQRNPLTEDAAIKFISLNNANSVLIDKNINFENLKNGNFADLLSQIYHPKMKGVLFIKNSKLDSELNSKIDEFTEFLEENLLTVFPHEYDFETHYLYSLDQNMEVTCTITENYSEINLNSNEKFDNSQEFIEYYSKKELIGKSLLFDEEEIKKLLRISKQDLNQEKFSIIKFDDEFKIADIKTQFIGGIDSTNVDPVILLGEFLSDNTKHYSVFHNHPSGSLAPSRADINLTSHLEKTLNTLDKNLLEHYIVSFNGVEKFSDLDYLKDPRYTIVSELLEKSDNIEKSRKIANKIVDFDFTYKRFIPVKYHSLLKAQTVNPWEKKLAAEKNNNLYRD